MIGFAKHSTSETWSIHSLTPQTIPLISFRRRSYQLEAVVLADEEENYVSRSIKFDSYAYARAFSGMHQRKSQGMVWGLELGWCVDACISKLGQGSNACVGAVLLDTYSFSRLIKAAHGLGNDVLILFNQMKELKLQPWLSGHSGLLNDAVEYIDQMHVEPSVMVRRALLVADENLKTTIWQGAVHFKYGSPDEELFSMRGLRPWKIPGGFV
ncbi:hypothetical protein ZIOFF_064490 [Zingiber officinale]|uniref:Uncharacterized protein n=1 Tax=Zingiber officinale TaxID=94328 RepID=A0A8J5EXY2_ZINOF|nr:hypothetical protein ZIOFF_064490 [Zingiber officinale]